MLIRRTQVWDRQRRGSSAIPPFTISPNSPSLQFEIAMEETEKMTVYAQEDRDAAREELDKLEAAYKEVVEGPDKEIGEEVRRRVGPRIRELSSAVAAMEELAQNQD